MREKPKHPWRTYEKAASGGLVTCFACGGSGLDEGLGACPICDTIGFITPEEARAMRPRKGPRHE